MIGPTFATTMFARRLALLGALVAAGSLLPAAQVLRLSTTRAAASREAAESRLVSQRLLPTTRGRILDRKGRVLATDRPAYGIAVDYPVITGQWAFTQAARKARRLHREWNELGPVQRETLAQCYVPEFEARLAEGWRRFAQLAEVPLEEIEARRAEIVEDVSRTAATVWERQRQRREEMLAKAADLADDEPGVRVSTAEVARPIREQTIPHLILRDVEDRIAFRFPIAKPGEGAPPADDPAGLPGVRVIDSAAREYPFDAVEVQVDRSHFPGPLRSDAPATYRVAGAAVHLVGWMRPRGAQEEDRWWADQSPAGGPPGPAPEAPRRRPSEDELASWRAAAARQRREPDDLAVRRAYQVGDAAGGAGIEWAAEQTLRGRRGAEVRRLDTGETTTSPREPGADVRLTLDAMLQSRIQALMSPEAGLAVVQPWQKNRAVPVGTPLRGAAVVIDVDTGDILAMVSTPTFTREDIRLRPEVVFADGPDSPWLNRAVGKPYPPGSIVKPLMLAAGATAGVFPSDRRVACDGHLYENQPTLFRCWIFKPPFNTTHSAVLGGPLDASEALMVSCNIYFFNIGRALGPERMAEWYAKFGVGPQALQARLGLPNVFPGIAGPLAPVPEDDEREMSDVAAMPEPTASTPRRPRMLSLGEATLMGIGQGPVAWTPLHAADAYATLARGGGGVRIVPRLRMDEPAVVQHLGLDQRAVETALRGLRRSVSEELGTGHHVTFEVDGLPARELTFNVPGVAVWGKSGTADSGVKVREAFTGESVSIDHSWFVVLAGPTGDRPRVAVSLLVEGGGSGGRVAGPLCNQILHALVAEGYL